MNLILVGLSHKTAPLELRERLAVPSPKIPSVLSLFLNHPTHSAQEVLILSTCNRVEIYLVSREMDSSINSLSTFFSEKSGLSPKDLEKHLYVKVGTEAIQHFFRVTSSLDSMVLGEPQVTGQVKEAYRQAVSCNTTGPYLNKLVHKALFVAKRIRTETGIAHHPVSISYAAVLLAEKIFGDLKNTRVLLLGAGEMGVLAARHLAERKVGQLIVSNRTTAQAHVLVDELQAVCVPFEETSQRLSEVDIILVATAAENYLIRPEAVSEAMRRRKNKPMFFIDIAVPRNVDPEVNQIENVYLYDVDHLQSVVDQNRQEREKEAAKAEHVIESEVDQFMEYLRQMELSPTIQQLSRKFDSIRREEITQHLSSLSRLSVEDREALEACTKAIVNKILHDPILLMKAEKAETGTSHYSDFLKKIFKLGEDS